MRRFTRAGLNTRSNILFLSERDFNVAGNDYGEPNLQLDELVPLNPYMHAMHTGEFSDILTREAFSMLTLAHEEAHWVRHQASTMGIWQNQLRKIRDYLNLEIFHQMAPTQKLKAMTARDAGVPLISTAVGQYGFLDSDDPLVNLSEAMFQARRIVTGEPSSHHGGDPFDAICTALRETVRVSSGAGLTESMPDRWLTRSRESGDRSTVTVRLLSEAASLLDELRMLDAGWQKMVGDELAGTVRRKFNSPYGEPIRLIRDQAGYEVPNSVCLAMIDFALNPPIPGLDLSIEAVRWSELDPPLRLERIARMLRLSPQKPLPEWPSADEVMDFRYYLGSISRLRYGRLSRRPNEPHPACWIGFRPGVDPFYASLERAASGLYAFGTSSPQLVSHFSILPIVRGIDFFSAKYWDQFTPALWSVDGDLTISADMDSDDSDKLMSATIAACAVDDLAYQVGEFTADHLPRSVLDNLSSEYLDEIILQATTLSSRFVSRFRHKSTR